MRQVLGSPLSVNHYLVPVQWYKSNKTLQSCAPEGSSNSGIALTRELWAPLSSGSVANQGPRAFNWFPDQTALWGLGQLTSLRKLQTNPQEPRCLGAQDPGIPECREPATSQQSAQTLRSTTQVFPGPGSSQEVPLCDSRKQSGECRTTAKPAWPLKRSQQAIL